MAPRARSRALIVARRQCLVCDAVQEVLESEGTDEIGPPCSSCRAPTERVAIVARGAVPKNPIAAELGRRGGLKGGPARASVLSPQRRREIARKAARTRWRRAK